MPRGGKREGAGRPPTDTPAKSRTTRWTDDEWAELRRRAEAAGQKVTDYMKSRTIGGD